MAQLNCYAHLLRENGYKPLAMSVAAILRDWTKSKAADSDDYPQQQVVTLRIPVWSQDKTYAYLSDRVKLHQHAQQAADNNDPLPLCSEEERWTRPGKVAICKRGRKRALKLVDNHQQAEEWMSGQNDSSDLYTEARPAQYPRCQSYCAVKAHCDFGRTV